MNYINVVYSHSSYNDILNIQNSFYKNIEEKKYLFIDKIIDNDSITNFDKIIFYDDNLNYSKRILSCLIQADIQEEYILYNSDINILISKNNEDINNLIEIMKYNDIYRFDFCNYKFINSEKNLKYKNYILVKNDDINNYIYNVGTALYKVDKYIKLLTIFDYSYREIEGSNSIQEYSKYNLNSYYINTQQIINAGYFALSNILIYIHISHYNKLLPIDNNINNLDENLQKIYENIITNFKFNKEFRTTMH